MSVFDFNPTSTFVQESTAALGANGVFTGPWHDALRNVNVGARSLADVVGTLNIDESPDAAGVGAVQVATAAAAAIGAGLPNTGKFLARIVEARICMRYWRVRYVNGAGAQASFDVESVATPI